MRGQQLVDDVEQLAPRAVHVFRGQALRRIEITLEQQLGRAEHVGHRRSQIVAEPPQKLERFVAAKLGARLRSLVFWPAAAHATSRDKSSVAMRRYKVARPMPSSLAARPTLPWVARSAR